MKQKRENTKDLVETECSEADSTPSALSEAKKSVRDAAMKDILRALERIELDPLCSPEMKTSEGHDMRAELVALGLKGKSPLFDHTIVERTMAAIGKGSEFAAAGFVELEPRDGPEKLLVSQMLQTHAHIQSVSVRLRDCEYLEQMAMFEKMYNRLTRTYVAQMEALRKHRTGGTQTVKHVHVQEGGQAVVADVVNTHKGGRANGT